MNVTGQSAIITGGHSGMGFAAAQALRAQGAKVAIIGRRKERVEAKAELIGAVGLACDISDPGAVDAALDAAEAVNGTARILINAAAIGNMCGLLNSDGSAAPLDAIRDTVAVNLLGTLYIDRAFASRLTALQPDEDQLRGVIINVSSIGAADGSGSVYAASKGGVNSLCLSLARDLDPWGIRVVTISPGGVDTELLRGGANDEINAAMRTMIPALRRVGRPEEFGALALHICQNNYLNACNIRLDGGFRIPYSNAMKGG